MELVEAYVHAYVCFLDKAAALSLAALLCLTRIASFHNISFIAEKHCFLAELSFLLINSTLRVSQQQYQIKMTREAKVEELREDVVAQLEEMLAIKTEEVSIIQEQLSLLSKGYVKETKMKDPYGDTGIYTGHVKENVPNGKGTMEYDDGRLYVGEWDAGRW